MYHTTGGEKQGTPNVIVSTNYRWTSGAWSTKAATPVPIETHGGFSPTTVGSGYIMGGDSSSSPFFPSRMDSYVLDAWTSEAAMPANRWKQASCSISGLGYSFGGFDSGSVCKADNYQFTPGGSWATRTAMTQARDWHKATNIGAKGYNLGGENSGGASTNTNYEYDPSADAWATKTSFPSLARNAMGCWTLSSVAYIIWGGPTAVNRNDSYVVDSWTAMGAVPNYPNVRQAPGSAGVDSISVGWVTGGITALGNILNNHDEWTPDAWSTRTVSPTTLYQNASILAPA